MSNIANVPTDTIYTDIHDMVHDGLYIYNIDELGDFISSDTLEAIAHGVLGDEDYQESDDPVADVFDGTGMTLCYFNRDSVLAWCLQRYIGEPPTDRNNTLSGKWAKTVRGIKLSDSEAKIIYFVHGVGYDWIDADLLGGSGDGSKRKEFEDGITIAANFKSEENA